ncbi:MAG TPA: amidohydrolase family protein [Candidatus Limnocylindrales bacterium]|nr:amidohydrolase family protein [Candidatus Limnocylindrales bacterium]
MATTKPTPPAAPPAAPVSRDGVEPRLFNTGERAGYHTTLHLENARRQAEERGFKDVLIVDADAHQLNEMTYFQDIAKYIEDEVLRHEVFNGEAGKLMYPGFRGPQHQSLAGRLVRYRNEHLEDLKADVPPEVEFSRREMSSIGIDYQVVFPTALLALGMHPDPDIETAMAWAYTRWLTEEILPHSPHVRTMVYLPMNQPEACLRFVERFGDDPGVVGFMVTSARYRPVHANEYMRLYGAIQERGLPLCFHAIYHQQERMFEGMNKFLSVHALGFIFYNLVHITNMVVNGIPERFPRLKLLWIESGLAWIPFLMQRLDNEYLMRSSEAPLLKKLPSDYMRDMYYTSQPIENNDHALMESTFRAMNAETQLLFSSDYPHWDFNLPSTIWDLPFLSEAAKRRILGQNAWDLFGLDRR